MGRLDVFFEHTELFRCPLCGSALHGTGTSLKCTAGHDFALGKKGYCDFASAKHTELYTRALFESRRRILSGRLFAPFTALLQDAVLSCCPEGVLLDAGCGEGTFLKAAAASAHIGLGADLAREGIKLAASGGNGLGWMVADLARLPLQAQSTACIINILSPAAYPEFHRVLQKDGVILKVVPGESYLKELRSLAQKAPHSEAAVETLFRKNTRDTEERELSSTFSLSEDEAVDLIRMTPLTEKAAVRADALKDITIHLKLLIGRKP